MSTKIGPGGDRLGIGEIYWFRYDLAEDDRLIEVLSDKGELFFYRLRKHYVYRAGTLPYDPSSICTKMGYKTVRPFNACFEELAAAGLVSVEDGMVRFPHGDRIIAEVQGSRDKKANDGRAGGEAKAASARNIQETSSNVSPNFDEVSSKHEIRGERNQTLSPSYQKTSNQESVNKTTSVGSTAPTHSLKTVGGGDVQEVIDEFYRSVAGIWGEDRMRSSRTVTSKNVEHAARWLELAGGSLEVVFGAMASAMEPFHEGHDCLGTLGAIKNSMPNKIDAYNRPATLTTADLKRNGSGKTNGAISTSSSPGNDIWPKVLQDARYYKLTDIEERIKALVRAGDIATANDFARSMEAIASGKKARAAA